MRPDTKTLRGGESRALPSALARFCRAALLCLILRTSVAHGWLYLKPAAFLPFGLNRPGEVSLRVFDASGRLVRTLVDGKCQAGAQAVTWDGHDLRGRRVANGIYFAKLQAEEDVQVRKVVLTR